VDHFLEKNGVMLPKVMKRFVAENNYHMNMMARE
jgi:hypothetical protein